MLYSFIIHDCVIHTCRFSVQIRHSKKSFLFEKRNPMLSLILSHSLLMSFHDDLAKFYVYHDAWRIIMKHVLLLLYILYGHGNLAYNLFHIHTVMRRWKKGRYQYKSMMKLNFFFLLFCMVWYAKQTLLFFLKNENQFPRKSFDVLTWYELGIVN